MFKFVKLFLNGLNSEFVGNSGDVTTDGSQLYIHNGITPGGKVVGGAWNTVASGSISTMSTELSLPLPVGSTGRFQLLISGAIFAANDTFALLVSMDGGNTFLADIANEDTYLTDLGPSPVITIPGDDYTQPQFGIIDVSMYVGTSTFPFYASASIAQILSDDSEYNVGYYTAGQINPSATNPPPPGPVNYIRLQANSTNNTFTIDNYTLLGL